MSLKSVCLIYRADLPIIPGLKDRITSFFEAAGVECIAKDLEWLQQSHSSDLPKPDLVMVLGGDGTFLSAARRFMQHKCPIVGVNAGNLGFLTRIEADDLDFCLNAILKNETSLEERLVLSISSAPNQWAVNDIVFKNTNPGIMAKISVYDCSAGSNEELITTYDADGLIITTPTGSTAYNLSAGGPILLPETPVIAITPICPHSLSAKPLILPESVKLKIEASPKNKYSLVCTMDGEDILNMKPGESLSIQAANERLPIVCFNTHNESFYALLKRKLSWANNPRTKS